MAKGLGWLTLILGILVLIFPWVTAGSTLQWIETVLGVITAVVGVTLLTGR